MDKQEIVRTLRKHYPTIMQEHYIDIEEYLDKIKTVDDKLALEMVTKYIINLKSKKK